MCILLPMARPDYMTLPAATHMFAVMKAHHLPRNWVASNMNQISVEEDLNTQLIHLPRIFTRELKTYRNNPQFECASLSAEALYRSQQGFKEQLGTYLQMGFYIVLCVDRFYISAYNDYQQRHLSHLLLVYGIKGGSILANDFFNDASGYNLYKSLTLSLAEIYQGFKANYQLQLTDQALDIFRVLPQKDIYPFNPKIYKLLVEDYLNSAPSWLRFFPDGVKFEYTRQPMIWGAACMQNYQKELERFIYTLRNDPDAITPNLRYYHMFNMYKKIVYDNLLYIGRLHPELDTEPILEKLAVVCTYLQRVEALVTKALLSGRPGHLENAAEEIGHMINLDHMAYEQMFELF